MIVFELATSRLSNIGSLARIRRFIFPFTLAGLVDDDDDDARKLLFDYW